MPPLFEDDEESNNEDTESYNGLFQDPEADEFFADTPAEAETPRLWESLPPHEQRQVKTKYLDSTISSDLLAAVFKVEVDSLRVAMRSEGWFAERRIRMEERRDLARQAIETSSYDLAGTFSLLFEHLRNKAVKTMIEDEVFPVDLFEVVTNQYHKLMTGGGKNQDASVVLGGLMPQVEHQEPKAISGRSKVLEVPSDNVRSTKDLTKYLMENTDARELDTETVNEISRSTVDPARGEFFRGQKNP